MISGLNVDIDFHGQTYHVQTESGSKTNPVVVTTVFKGGAILSSRKSSFAHLLDSPDLVAGLKSLMDKQHKDTIEDLKSGKVVKPPASGSQPSTAKTKGQPVQPAPTARSRSLDDLILDYLSAKEEKDK
jgi:hypothetical protein